MGWGDSFKSAWNSVSETARNNAAAIATGAKAVGKKALEVGKKGVDKSIEVAKWAADQTVKAANWANDQAKAAARAGGRSVVNAVAAGATKAKDALDSAKKAVSQVAEKARQALNRVNKLFGANDPKKPVAPCPLANKALSDVDQDGALIIDSCKALTSKDKPITKDDIENAKAHGYKSKSQCCKGKPEKTIFYVNGIGTDKETHCDTLKAIAESTCATVVGVYNATDGTNADLFQAAKDRELIKAAAQGHLPRTHDGRNPAVDTLSDVIDKEQGVVEVWAHSQGGAIASLALYEANARLEMAGADYVNNPLEKTRVKSFGSAAPEWVNGPKFEHYVHANDLTPIYTGLGDKPAADKIVFSGDPKKGMFQTTDLDKHYFPHPDKYHGIEETYLKMQEQVHGGCGGKP